MRPYKAYFMECIRSERLDCSGQLRCVIARRKPQKRNWKIHRFFQLKGHYGNKLTRQDMEAELLQAFQKGSSWGRNRFQ